MFAATVALLMLSRMQIDTPYIFLGIAFLVMGSGMGLVMPPATTSIMATLPLGKAGVGSAVNDTTREVGGALGVAILGSLLASSFRTSIDDALGAAASQVPEALRSSVGGAVSAGLQRGGRAGDALVTAGREAYVDGMGVALLVAAGIMLFGAITASRYFPKHAEEHPVPTLLPETAEVEGPEAVQV